MARLLVLVEGETEETFVKELLAAPLCAAGYTQVSARLIGNARARSRRGGIKPWGGVRTEILRHLRRDAGICVTTMVDYYGLPAGNSPGRGWPGRADASAFPPELRASIVESAIFNDIRSEPNDGDQLIRRFQPFVVMHEFEGLLFSNCERFARGMERPELEPQLQSIRDQFDTPEQINDSPQTHPSARVLELLPQYEKPLLGNLAALEIGLNSILAECPHFRNWYERLIAAASSC